MFYEGHLPAFAVNTLDQEGARAAGRRRAPRNDFRARHRPRDRGGGRRARQSGVAVASRRARLRRGRRTALIADAIATPTSSATVTRCCRTRRRSGRSSSTKTCTRKHSPTCGTSCRTRPSASRSTTSRSPPRLRAPGSGPGRRGSTGRIPAGIATLGTRDGFAWDNERPAHVRRASTRSTSTRTT